jgi:hypothetical protein
VPRSLLLCAMLRSRLWEKLLEVLQKIRRSSEQGRDLRVYVLYGLRLALVRLQYFEKLLVDVGLRRKAVLTGCQ